MPALVFSTTYFSLPSSYIRHSNFIVESLNDQFRSFLVHAIIHLYTAL
jgi:hypothetical protein